jgi:hypothetical protein
MQRKARHAAWASRIGLAIVLAASPLAVQSATLEEHVFAIELVAPGMNRTELTSVMGPPTYIQVKGLREAWQFCPPRSFERFVNELLRQPTDPKLYVTVWLNSGRVEHMRAYPSRVMGQCEDFLAAFSWEDVIDGEFAVGADGYRIK